MSENLSHLFLAVAHDIAMVCLGAQGLGLATVLIAGGIHAEELLDDGRDDIQAEKLESLCHNFETNLPSFVMASL